MPRRTKTAAPEAEVPKSLYTAKGQIHHDNDEYDVGDEIELTAAQAESLGELIKPKADE